MARLTAQAIKKADDGRHSDGDGLYLFVRGTSHTWVYRYQLNRRRRDMQLGTYPQISLKEAREARHQAAKLRDEGIDPIDAREALKAERRRSEPEGPWTCPRRYFGRIIHDTFEARKPALKGDGTAGRWMSPLNTHVIPKAGLVDIGDVSVDLLQRLLEPIWRTKPDAALKCYQRLVLVMDRAAAQFPDEIDATIMPRLKTLLGQQGHKVQNIPSMPWAEIPALYRKLGETPTELALRLLILTASRSGPVRLARIEQFEGDVWTIPAEAMKVPRPLRIPLSPEARRVIDLALPLARDGNLFCARRGKPLSDAAMAKWLTRERYTARPHGFRSSFRDWATDTGEDWVLTEKALAHKIGNKAQQAYDRTDALDLRRDLMLRWTDHVTGATVL